MINNRREKTRTGSKTASNIVFACIVLILVTVIMSNYGYGPFKFIVIKSGSMAPTIRVGDLAVVYKGDKTPSIGDIVLFKKEGIDIIHRIVSIEQHTYRTKGDANNAVDAWHVNQIEGVYIARVPLLGYILSFMQRGFMIIFGGTQ